MNSVASLQTPVERPARPAAPRAVVSTRAGRLTGTPRTPAWNSISQSFMAAPPSTRSSRVATPESPSMAWMTSEVE